ncbi:hypothetical protein MRX96_050606 [Rhipicephalus microplus]
MLAGALFLVESWEFEEDERILENLDFPCMLLSHLEVLLFSFGLALFTVSSCGCVGALRENTFLLNMYPPRTHSPDSRQLRAGCSGIFRSWEQNWYKVYHTNYEIGVSGFKH